MNKSTTISILVFALIAAGAWYVMSRGSVPVAEEIKADPKNATYTIEGQTVVLKDGYSEAPSAPGSAQMNVTQYFGNDATGDLNGDGMIDAAFVLTQTGGGSGTFYYVVAALKTAAGYEGTNAVLLGDRIAPQSTAITNGEVVVNYATRKNEEPMTAQPSVGVSKYLRVDGTTLVEAPPVVALGEHCGGNMMNAPVCAEGLHCAATPGSHLPMGDVGGTCVSGQAE